MKQCNRKREVQDDLISPATKATGKELLSSGWEKLLVEQFWGTESSCSILDVLV